MLCTHIIAYNQYIIIAYNQHMIAYNQCAISLHMTCALSLDQRPWAGRLRSKQSSHTCCLPLQIPRCLSELSTHLIRNSKLDKMWSSTSITSAVINLVVSPPLPPYMQCWVWAWSATCERQQLRNYNVLNATFNIACSGEGGAHNHCCISSITAEAILYGILTRLILNLSEGCARYARWVFLRQTPELVSVVFVMFPWCICVKNQSCQRKSSLKE